MTAAPGPQQPDEEVLRGQLDRLWGWAKSGKTYTDPDGGFYYLMDNTNVDGFTDAVMRLIRTAAPSAQPERYEGATGNVMPPDGVDWSAQPVRDTEEGRR